MLNLQYGLTLESSYTNAIHLTPGFYIGFLTITTFKIVKLPSLSSLKFLVYCVIYLFLSFLWLMENKMEMEMEMEMTLKMTSAQIVETSVTNNSSSQNYPPPDDHTIRTTDTPGFKPFTIVHNM